MLKWKSLSPDYGEINEEGKYIIRTQSMSKYSTMFPKEWNQQIIESKLTITKTIESNGKIKITRHFDINNQIAIEYLKSV